MQDVNITNSMKMIVDNVDTSVNMSKPISEWRNILAQECQVYVCGRSYIAKRFDEINYQFVEEAQAIKIVKDNLYALLRFKYFTLASEQSDERIQKIVQSFTANLKTTLKKVSFDLDDECTHISMLPSYCCAFRNGVYDFLHNKWLFKYDIIKINHLSNTLYMYDSSWAIMWYVNINFTPLEEIDIMTLSIDDLIDIMKEMSKDKTQYCFELMYNMSHNVDDKFSKEAFVHLCEIFGYLLHQAFIQHFVIMVGSGGNGKNSLFDGCFTNRVVPTPTNISLDTIEEDNFISGAMVSSHNIHLETSTDEKPHTESENIKNLTGSMYQMIHHKGVDMYSGILNVKQLFAANSQDHIKFSDTTPGFRRRVNVFEIWYEWDDQKRFLKRGDYYDLEYSDDFHEIKNDINNTIWFIYFGMMGMKSATRNFTKNFKFTYNDWKMKYSDVNLDLKEKLDSITVDEISRFMFASKQNEAECRALFFDEKKSRLYDNVSMNEMGYSTMSDLKKFFTNPEHFTEFFADNNVYINVKLLKTIIGSLDTATAFTQSIKKLYGAKSMKNDLYNNQPYIKCTFVGRKLKILK